MTIVLYDLVGRDDRRFSPHCWRTRMALAHKGLAYKARPTRFSDIRTIASGQVKTIPAIEDGDRLVVDSIEIARYLEANYPDRPSLFDGAGGNDAIHRMPERSSFLPRFSIDSSCQLEALSCHGKIDQMRQAFPCPPERMVVFDSLENFGQDHTADANILPVHY